MISVHCQGKYPNSARNEVTEHWSFMIIIIIKYYLGDQTKTGGMGGACGTWEEDKCRRGFGRNKHKI